MTSRRVKYKNFVDEFQKSEESSEGAKVLERKWNIRFGS